MKLSMKKHEILKKNFKFRGGLLGLKDFMMILKLLLLRSIQGGSTPSVTFITEKVLKFNSFFELLGLVPPSSNTELICTKEEDGDVMFIEIAPKDDNSRMEEPEAGEQEVEYFNVFPTRSELAYHKYLTCGLIPSIFL
ncbi:hypothetical protein Tco_0954618 [Tanacetum coccineum]|uniref:Uncharacterized protein n=1 Tax=Tanacetum coccineum TaxID=301880 RepID=A0ABQ5E4W4_9ASTR